MMSELHNPDQAYLLHMTQIEELLRTCEADEKHARQVCRLALDLFHQVNPIFNMSTQERTWLEYAALLHDIGWVQGRQGHHKASLEIILNTPILDLSNKERLVIGSIARYHRKAAPSKRHDHYAALRDSERKTTRRLSAILRMGNALDASHQSLVDTLHVQIKKKHLLITCFVTGDPIQEREKVEISRKYLERECKKDVQIKWQFNEVVL